MENASEMLYSDPRIEYCELTQNSIEVTKRELVETRQCNSPCGFSDRRVLPSAHAAELSHSRLGYTASNACKADRFEPHKCTVEKVIEVSDTEFRKFIEHPEKRNYYLPKYKDLMG